MAHLTPFFVPREGGKVTTELGYKWSALIGDTRVMFVVQTDSSNKFSKLTHYASGMIFANIAPRVLANAVQHVPCWTARAHTSPWTAAKEACLEAIAEVVEAHGEAAVLKKLAKAKILNSADLPRLHAGGRGQPEAYLPRGLVISHRMTGVAILDMFGLVRAHIIKQEFIPPVGGGRDVRHTLWNDGSPPIWRVLVGMDDYTFDCEANAREYYDQRLRESASAFAEVALGLSDEPGEGDF